MFRELLVAVALIAQSNPDLQSPDETPDALPENLEGSTPAQTPPPVNPDSPPDSFKDPFSDAPANTPAENNNNPTIMPMPTPTPAPEAAPSNPDYLPPGGPAPYKSNEGTAPQQQPALPEPPPFEQGGASGGQEPNLQGIPGGITPVQPDAAPKPDFQFPDQGADEQQVPITKDVIQSADLARSTDVGTWSVAGGLGGAFNLNNLKNQIEMNIAGGYRLYPEWEVGLRMNYRVVHDTLLGFVATAHYAWRFTEPPKTRMDLLLGGGLGYTFFAPKNTFTYGMVTVRGDANLLIYAWNRFAFDPGIAIEMFPLGWATTGKIRNGFKKPGLPIHLIVSVGIRYEF